MIRRDLKRWVDYVKRPSAYARFGLTLIPRVGGGIDPAPNLEANTGSQAAPTWTSMMGANHELRWSDTNVAANTASASWPQTTRPSSGTAQVTYLFGYTADATGSVVTSDGAFALADYLQLRWNNSAAGTYASAPILTAYPSTAHGAITAGDGSILGGSADTSNTSYIKGNAYGFGFQTTAQTPATAPTGAFPTVTDATAGSVATLTGAWQNAGAKWQAMMGDTDYITSGGASWDGSAGKLWYFMLALFMGANMTPGLLQPVISLKYTYT